MKKEEIIMFLSPLALALIVAVSKYSRVALYFVYSSSSSSFHVITPFYQH